MTSTSLSRGRLEDHPFEPNRRPHPRYQNACDRCTKVKAAHPTPRVRDTTIEDAFIGQALELAKRHGWPLSTNWTIAVDRRLAMGDREYGNRALNQDNLPDILEETPDLGTYPVLELQRLMYEDSPDLEIDQIDLMAIAAHGAAAHYHGQRILRRRAGLED